MSRLAHKAMNKDLGSTRIWRPQTRSNIYGMNNYFRRSLRDRYKVIYDLPSPTAMIPGAKASKAATMITDGLGLRNC